VKRHAFPLFAAVSLSLASAQAQQKAVTIDVVNNRYDRTEKVVRDGLSSDSLTSRSY